MFNQGDRSYCGECPRPAPEGRLPGPWGSTGNKYSTKTVVEGGTYAPKKVLRVLSKHILHIVHKQYEGGGGGGRKKGALKYFTKTI